jgi:hypothetical protein
VRSLSGVGEKPMSPVQITAKTDMLLVSETPKGLAVC